MSNLRFDIELIDGMIPNENGWVNTDNNELEQTDR